MTAPRRTLRSLLVASIAGAAAVVLVAEPAAAHTGRGTGVVDGVLHPLTGLDHLVTEFAFGGMPHHEAEGNLRLFADRVMPVLQRDAAFAAPASASRPDASVVGQAEGIFAPA